MGVDAIYYCKTCRKIVSPGRAIEGYALRKFLNGVVTQEKIDKVKAIQKQLDQLFEEEWLHDYYDMRRRYDLSALINFLQRHLDHEVVITNDHALDWDELEVIEDGDSISAR